MELGLTNYEINQQLMANEKPLDPIALNRALYEIAEHIYDWQYTMLLCRERNDYTVFHKGGDKLESRDGLVNIVKEVKETLENRGTIVTIDKQEQGNYEIWLRNGDENVLYMLFDCFDFIVEC